MRFSSRLIGIPFDTFRISRMMLRPWATCRLSSSRTRFSQEPQSLPVEETQRTLRDAALGSLEFCLRFNLRNSSQHGMMFYRLLERPVEAPLDCRLTEFGLIVVIRCSLGTLG